MNNNFNNNNPNNQNFNGPNLNNGNSNKGSNFNYQNNSLQNNNAESNRGFQYTENHIVRVQQQNIPNHNLNNVVQKDNINRNYQNTNHQYNLHQPHNINHQYKTNHHHIVSHEQNFNQQNRYIYNQKRNNNNYNIFSYNNPYDANRNRSPILNKDSLDYIKKNGMSGIDYYGTIPDEKRYDMYLYTLIELNNMGISVENTVKKFYMGKMYYKLTDEYLNYLYEQQNGNISNQEANSFTQSASVDANYESSNNDFDNKEEINYELDVSDTNNGNNFLNDYNDSEEQYFDFESDQSLEHNQDVYMNEDYVNGTTYVDGDIPDYDKYNLENLINVHNDILFNQDKNLESDLEYKIYNLSFNKEQLRKDLGKLDNITFDVYPKDRIMVLSSDESKTSTTLIDVLSRRYEKNGGYVYFNIKRKQKWIDMYSKEFKQYDLDMINKKSDILYQLESPDYFSYGAEKRDTPLSLFKKVFYAIDVIVSETLFYKLIEIFDFKPVLKKVISQLSDVERRIFILICDILIGKHVLLIPLTEFKLEINRKIDLFTLLNDLSQNKYNIVIFSSWDILDAKIFANRVICLDKGKKILDKNVNDILKVHESLDSFLLEYLQSSNRSKRNFSANEEQSEYEEYEYEN